MSTFDLNNLSNSEIVAQYILELRRSGHILPYDDYLLIKTWLGESNNNLDQLLLILSDVLPNYYSKRIQSGPPPTLKSVNKSILKKIQEFNGRAFSL